MHRSANSSPNERDDGTQLAVPSTALGVLLTNLGTPDEPSPEAVRRFLGEMLSDRRIVSLPRIVWWPILHGIVLRTRPRRSAHAYSRIWSAEGSPQLVFGRKLVAALRAELTTRGHNFVGIELGMRYGNPSIAAALARLRAAGAQRMLVLPLFPQYSAATTASTYDALTRQLSDARNAPETHLVADYHDEPDYIAALAASVREHWQHEGRAGHLVMSFHGMPQASVRQGDPYLQRCRRSASLLAEALALAGGEWSLAFQSRFGAQEWLRPYTLDVLTDLARHGVKRVQVICPGFSLDCLETLEEIALSAAETFRARGGERLDYIAALNHRADHVACLAGIVERHVDAWSAARPLHDVAGLAMDAPSAARAHRVR